ncbi:MAG: glutamine-hydrolyzing GMP synthase [Leptospiraceae bacterium]|nr:glutamine-hydrolyzing GMP synthase [Leptospiraceae bacterium]
MEIQQKIGIIDFGGQYAHLISSRLRRLGAYTDILSNEEEISKYSEYSGLIFSGGPSSVYQENAPSISEEIFSLNIPILGICYGHQLIMKMLGGVVNSTGEGEFGEAFIEISDFTSPLITGLGSTEKVWMSHGDEVSSLAPGFTVFAESSGCKNAGVYSKERRIVGIQFHPEVTHTTNGNQLLLNFINLCGVSRNWDMEHFLEIKLKEINDQVPKNKKVFMLVSGGVDSTVAYTLLARALGGKRVVGLLVDTGFMRKNEVKLIQKNLSDYGFNLNIVDASEKFYSALKGIKYPETKRKIIGQLFIDVKNEESEKIIQDPENWILGQGTIYPDTIESGGTKHSHNIKTHHNRGEEILELMQESKLIEPIKELYQDEVRELGRVLGLKESVLMRHPFPGPGLAVRMIVSKDDFQFKEFNKLEEVIFLINKKVKYKILPIKSVGVQGDARTYMHCALVNDFSKNWEKYNKISTEITNKIREINRVAFLPFGKKLPKKLIFTDMELDREHSDLLREADDIVTKILFEEKINSEIWQMPVALLPVGKKKKRYSIVLRPVNSTEAMTANFYPMKRKILKKIVKSILKIRKISYVFYDITNKPPGTIEWE